LVLPLGAVYLYRKERSPVSVAKGGWSSSPWSKSPRASPACSPPRATQPRYLAVLQAAVHLTWKSRVLRRQALGDEDDFGNRRSSGNDSAGPRSPARRPRFGPTDDPPGRASGRAAQASGTAW